MGYEMEDVTEDSKSDISAGKGESADDPPEVIGCAWDTLSRRINYAKGTTLGPVRFPADRAARVARLQSIIASMQKLGWIDSAEVAADLSQGLQKLRAVILASHDSEAMTQATAISSRARALFENGHVLSEVRDFLAMHMSLLTSATPTAPK